MVYASSIEDMVANFRGRTHVLFCLSIVIISVQRKRNCLLDQNTDTEVRATVPSKASISCVYFLW